MRGLRPRRASTGRSSARPRPGPARPSTSPACAELRARSGLTGGWPANFGGISISALLISTATGFRSRRGPQAEPLRLERDRAAAAEGVEHRRRVAVRSSGGSPRAPPRAPPRSCVFSHCTSCSMIRKSRWPLSVLHCLLGRESVGASEGRRRGWRRAPPGRPRAAAAPTRGAASRGARGGSTSLAPKAALIASSGSATSMSLRVTRPRPRARPSRSAPDQLLIAVSSPSTGLPMACSMSERRRPIRSAKKA